MKVCTCPEGGGGERGEGGGKTRKEKKNDLQEGEACVGQGVLTLTNHLRATCRRPHDRSGLHDVRKSAEKAGLACKGPHVTLSLLPSEISRESSPETAPIATSSSTSKVDETSFFFAGR